jgi:hypothetical protein
MKKYYLAALLIMQSCGAMELDRDPFDRSIEYDDKCWSVARYLYKYPQGKNAQEAKAIERFFEDRVSECVTVCPWLVTKYKNILDTQEAHRYLNNLYTYQEIHIKNPKWNEYTDKEELCYEIRFFSPDLRKKIFTQALWFVAQDYYVAQNSLKFLAIKQPTIWSPYSSKVIKLFYEPYFLAEINKKDMRMHFSMENGLLEQTIWSTATLCEGDKKLNCECTSTIYHCPQKRIKELIAFLDEKDKRVDDFTEMFNSYIEQLSCVDKKEGSDAFIFLLTRFKELTKHIIYFYTGRDRLT